MSVRVSNRVWESSSRTGTELLTLLALADFSNGDEGESFPSLSVLARKVRLSIRQVCHILDGLEQAGEIRRERSSGGWNQRTHYFILIPQNCEVSNTVTGNSVTDNTEFQRQETVKPASHALNHHRTINKSGAKAPRLSSPLTKSKLTRPDPVQLRAFEAWYAAYPKHVGKNPALKAWLKLNPDPALVETINAATARYVDIKTDVEPRFVHDPATWLKDERWTDEVPTGAGNGHAKPQVKDLGDGWVIADGQRMRRETYERRAQDATRSGQ